MKVAILGESPADEAAIRILVDQILGQPTESVALNLRTRGWPSVRDVLPPVLRQLHYHSDAEAFVVIADSNSSPVHQPKHDQPGPALETCRLCQLRKVVAECRAHLRPVTGRPPLKTAIGLAVPAIEAWWRCGHDPHVTEATWIQGVQAGREPYSRNALKTAVYGTDRPSLALARSRMVDEARRLAGDLSGLAGAFPTGFGALARDLRGW